LHCFRNSNPPVEVAIALDPSADQVRTIYREYWELEGMYGLVHIYEEGKYDLHDLLRLHKIVKDLGMEKQDIINALELVRQNQLQTLQSRVENLRYQTNVLETQKRKYMDHIFNLKRTIHEAEETLAQKRGEMAYLNRESSYNKS
jgi:predicted nuclease with TOPRIM domain